MTVGEAPPRSIHMCCQLRIALHHPADVGVKFPNEGHVVLKGLGGALLMIALDLQRKGGGRRVGKREGEGFAQSR